MNALQCPNCADGGIVVKNSHNRSGTARHRYQRCGRTFTPHPKERGYGVALQQDALRLYVEGVGIRAIAWLLHVAPQSVSNWLTPTARRYPTV